MVLDQRQIWKILDKYFGNIFNVLIFIISSSNRKWLISSGNIYVLKEKKKTFWKTNSKKGIQARYISKFQTNVHFFNIVLSPSSQQPVRTLSLLTVIESMIFIRYSCHQFAWFVDIDSCQNYRNTLIKHHFIHKWRSDGRNILKSSFLTVLKLLVFSHSSVRNDFLYHLISYCLILFLYTLRWP